MIEYPWGDGMQIIFHIDLNAFFANAEIAVNPSLKGKPIVISSESKRGIVSTASYEARKFGIHSAMPLFKAKELCPKLITIPPHFDLYKDLSSQFFSLLSEYSLMLEVASIDECYLDMTEYIIEHSADPYETAKEIQNAVLERLNLSCSIGIAPNKFLAKMGSDMKKPLGITVITNSNFKSLIWPLPVEDMMGVGKKTSVKLHEIGIHTIGDIADYKNYDILRSIFGKNTLLFYHKANGKDSSKVNTKRNELKSVGNSTTFESDTNDLTYIKSKFKELSISVSNRAKKRNLVSNSISITVKYTRELSKTKQMIINHYTNDTDIIYSTALILFDSLYNNEKIRLVGVSLNNVILFNDIKEQLSLFEVVREDQTLSLIKELNSNFNNKQFMKASELMNDKIQNKYKKE